MVDFAILGIIAAIMAATGAAGITYYCKKTKRLGFAAVVGLIILVLVTILIIPMLFIVY